MKPRPFSEHYKAKFAECGFDPADCQKDETGKQCFDRLMAATKPLVATAKSKPVPKPVDTIETVVDADPDIQKLAKQARATKLKREIREDEGKLALADQLIADVQSLVVRLAEVAEREAKIGETERQAEEKVAGNAAAMEDMQKALGDKAGELAQAVRELEKADAHCLAMERKQDAAAQIAADAIAENQGGNLMTGWDTAKAREIATAMLVALDVTIVPEPAEEGDAEEGESDADPTEEVPTEPIIVGRDEPPEPPPEPQGFMARLKRRLAGNGQTAKTDDDLPIRVG